MGNWLAMRRVVMAAMLSVASVECGGGGTSPGNDGGPAGPDGGNAIALPDCLKNLMAACPTDGECTRTTVDAGSEEYAFDSGVRVTSTTQPMPGFNYCFGGPTVVTVRKPDGSVCYSLESYAFKQQACEYWTLTWRDASGATVATGSTGPGSGAASNPSIACTGGAHATCEERGNRCCNLNSLGGCGSTTDCSIGTLP